MGVVRAGLFRLATSERLERAIKRAPGGETAVPGMADCTHLDQVTASSSVDGREDCLRTGDV